MLESDLGKNALHDVWGRGIRRADDPTGRPWLASRALGQPGWREDSENDEQMEMKVAELHSHELQRAEIL
jgi:hypothetical protein